MAIVGFQSALYTVVEGEDVMVTVCVSVLDLSAQLTDVISLDYSLSAQPNTATGTEYLPIMLVHRYRKGRGVGGQPPPPIIFKVGQSPPIFQSYEAAGTTFLLCLWKHDCKLYS